MTGYIYIVKVEDVCSVHYDYFKMTKEDFKLQYKKYKLSDIGKRAIYSYLEDNDFDLQIIETCNSDILTRAQFWLDFYRINSNCINKRNFKKKV